MDVMLCWEERCTFCSKVFGPEETLEDRKAAAECEESRQIDVTESPHQGKPFVHSKDLKIRSEQGGRRSRWAFQPVGVEPLKEETSVPGEGELRELNVVFTACDKKLRINCLACVEDRCAVCAKAREEGEKQQKRGAKQKERKGPSKQKEPSRGAKKKAPTRGSKGKEPKPSTNLPSKSSGKHVVSCGRQEDPEESAESGTDAEDGHEWGEQITIDDDGQVYRIHVAAESVEPSPSMEAQKRIRQKGLSIMSE